MAVFTFNRFFQFNKLSMSRKRGPRRQSSGELDVLSFESLEPATGTSEEELDYESNVPKITSKIPLDSDAEDSGLRVALQRSKGRGTGKNPQQLPTPGNSAEPSNGRRRNAPGSIDLRGNSVIANSDKSKKATRVTVDAKDETENILCFISSLFSSFFSVITRFWLPLLAKLTGFLLPIVLGIFIWDTMLQPRLCSTWLSSSFLSWAGLVACPPPGATNPIPFSSVLRNASQVLSQVELVELPTERALWNQKQALAELRSRIVHAGSTTLPREARDQLLASIDSYRTSATECLSKLVSWHTRVEVAGEDLKVFGKWLLDSLPASSDVIGRLRWDITGYGRSRTKLVSRLRDEFISLHESAVVLGLELERVHGMLDKITGVNAGALEQSAYELEKKDSFWGALLLGLNREEREQLRRTVDLLQSVQSSTRQGANSIEKLKSVLRSFAERLQILGDGADELSVAKEVEEVRVEAGKLLARAEKLAALKKDVLIGSTDGAARVQGAIKAGQ